MMELGVLEKQVLNVPSLQLIPSRQSLLLNTELGSNPSNDVALVSRIVGSRCM